jgi:transposase-like protein
VRPFDLSEFVGFRFPPEVILLAVHWYLRFGLSYRDLEELHAERGIDVDHATFVPVGATLHSVVDRRGATVPPHRRPALAR